MSKLILGIHGGHNASAAIGTATRLEFAIQEERLTGEKNYWGFPFKSVQACLDALGATPDDLEAVAYGSNMVLATYHDRQAVLRSYGRQLSVRGKVRQRVLMPARLKLQPGYGSNRLTEYLAVAGLGRVPLAHTEHHPNHASTAYYGLRSDPDRRYLVMTCDGSGDGVCATVNLMGGEEQPEELARTHWAQLARSAVLLGDVRLRLHTPRARVQADGHGALRAGERGRAGCLHLPSLPRA